jgi:2-amino-4-hydroxy-6-hydroxymethyldihydropteridine diphosphokinase
MGSRLELLKTAVAAIPDVVGVSAIYETDPVGGPEGQGRFFNIVVELSTTLTARELLDLAGHLEREANRIRTVRNGPRTLDVDVLFVADETVDEPDLQVPHPRMRERAFVLVPLHDLAPDLVSAQELADVAAAGDGVRRVLDWEQQ